MIYLKINPYYIKTQQCVTMLYMYFGLINVKKITRKYTWKYIYNMCKKKQKTKRLKYAIFRL